MPDDTNTKPVNDLAPATPTDNPVEKPVQVRTMPGRNGGTLNVGGNHGGGRPPNAWKARMAKLADRWAQAAEAKRILDDPDHPEWMAAGRFAAEQAYGKPKDADAGAPRVMRFLFVSEGKQFGLEVEEGGEETLRDGHE